MCRYVGTVGSYSLRPISSIRSDNFAGNRPETPEMVTHIYQFYPIGRLFHQIPSCDQSLYASEVNSKLTLYLPCLDTFCTYM